MRIGIRPTGQRMFNYDIREWDRPVNEYYDLDTGETVPPHVADDNLGEVVTAHGRVHVQDARETGAAR